MTLSWGDDRCMSLGLWEVGSSTYQSEAFWASFSPSRSHLSVGHDLRLVFTFCPPFFLPAERASLQDSLLSVGDALLFLQKATSWLPLLFARPGAMLIQAFTPALPLCIYFWPFEAVSLYFFLFSFLSSLCLSEMGY